MVKAEDILADILAGKPVKYDNETIEGELDLSKLKLLMDGEGRVHITASIEIKNSEILGNAKFRNVVFEEQVIFKNTNFSGYARFNGANFIGDVNFSDAVFSSRANFTNAQFDCRADFSKVEFACDAYFGEARFICDADFHRAQFGGNAHFGESQFRDNVGFSWAKFRGDAHFDDAQFHKILDLYNLKLGRLFISWDSIKDKLGYYDKNNKSHLKKNRTYGPTYLTLIKNFKVVEQFDDADNCYYKYRRESQRRKSWFDWSWVLDFVGWVSCGYGVRLKRIVGCALVFVLVFGVFYGKIPAYYGGIARDVPSTTAMAALNNSSLLLAFTTNNINSTLSWWEPFYFSAMAFIGATPEGLHSVGLCKCAVMIEGILGYFLLGLFVVVLARKLIR